MPTLPFRDYYVEQTPELRGVYCLCWAGCRSWCLNKELPPQSTHGGFGRMHDEGHALHMEDHGLSLHDGRRTAERA